MTTSRLPLLVVPLLCLIAMAGAASAAPPTEQEVRAAIEAIEKDPLAAAKAGQAKTVMTFAEESPDVSVILERELLPFAGNKQDPHTPLLTAAFVAGNVKSQLDSKKNKDDSYAGLQALFKAYHQIQASEKDYKVDSIDQLEALDKEGKLKEKVEQVQKKHGH
jgi:hypothetical protein